MSKRMRMFFLGTGLVSMILPTLPVAAAPTGPGVLYTVILTAGEFGSQNYTSQLASSLTAIRKFCARIEEAAYRVDCLAERLGKVADEIPADGTDYAEVRAALKDTSDELAELARRNRDPGLPRGRATTGGGQPETTTRPLTPVNRANLEDVNRRALAILEETETLLLRSAEGSQSKASQYATIAQALGSNKVLLRSA